MKASLYQRTKRIRQIVGGGNYTKLQSILKFILNFRHDYGLTGRRSQYTNQTYVFMIDGKTVHGGLSDRFRGAMSVYSYCKANHKDFKICWTFPFKLQDYLVPAKAEWVAEREELSWNLREAGFKFFNSYTGLNGQTEAYYRLLKSNKREVHVYSNVTIEEERYAENFHELFRPAARLQAEIDGCRQQIGGRYISITFRFIGLLGDFKDDDRFLKEDADMDAAYYIGHGRACIERMHTEYPEHKILVTADSPTFLERVKDLPYVYVIPGQVIHMDRTANDDYDLHLKSFVDFFMISYAERCFIYHTGNMFHDTKFAKTAALIGGKEVVKITD